MATTYNSVHVKCPFYKTETKKARSLTCEGATDGSSFTVRFVRDEYYEAHRQSYCCSVYTECSYYKLIVKKYKDPETV